MAAFILMAVPIFVQPAMADESSLQIVESFNKSSGNIQNPNDPTVKRKQEIMFIMGIPLLVMLIATAVLGIAMGVFGKKVFVAHMVLASLSLCLAVAHAIVGLVWFFPF
jgi:predicted RND superfamily exporter protein